MSREQVLEVWGDLACFSRPDMKVERFSYPVITPSAARGIFDAIYCKPKAFFWQVKRIEILSPPRYIALRRNENKEKISVSAISRFINGTQAVPIYADGARDILGTDMKGRTQRQTMALKNVHYRLFAEIRPWGKDGKESNAYVAQFKRRAMQGKCFYQPFFGCREFPAYFTLSEEVPVSRQPVNLNMDLGLMLYDVFDLSRPGHSSDVPKISLFRAEVSSGVLDVPSYEDSRVLKPTGETS